MSQASEEFLNEISHKKVYRFVSHHIRNSEEPHFFVCVGFDSENVMLLSCFTTKMDKKIKFVKSRGLCPSTLVFVKPSSDNGLTRDCGTNCNDIYLHSKSEFEAMFLSNDIEHRGDLEDVYYSQIYIGINNSDMVEEDTKSKIINID